MLTTSTKNVVTLFTSNKKLFYLIMLKGMLVLKNDFLLYFF